MAETDKSLKDSIVATIQSAQKAVGSAITGGATAVATSGVSVDLLEDIRSVGKENEKTSSSSASPFLRCCQFLFLASMKSGSFLSCSTPIAA